MSLPQLAKTKLGQTGVDVTRFGLGGEGVLRTEGREPEATRLIRRAVDLGVTYFESARAYAGSEEYLGKALGSDRQNIFLTSKSAQRTKLAALRDLDTTLRNLRTDYLDLWQVHDLRTEAEWLTVTGPGGALEAFEQARSAGKVRFIGITGHHDPFLLQRAIQEYEFATVLMPVNVAEAHLHGFIDGGAPAAKQRGMAVVGMKVMGGGVYLRAGLPAGALLRWALAQAIDVVTVGCGNTQELEDNITATARGQLSAGETAELLSAIAPQAKRAAYYRGVFR
jgi:aryl-alcohol dehydrogenase-like predicted oxidoreductase